jgi:predicted phage-related endonuclease
MALTAKQIKFRSKVIGGSDANIIMGGDEDALMRLWEQKTGRAEGEDLSNVLQVQLGAFTEAFNIQWFEQQTRRKVTHQGEEMLSMEYPVMACTLDGLTDDELTVFEAKHVSAFAKSEDTFTKYIPQLTHNMLVAGKRRSVLSVIYGNHKWEAIEFDLDNNYAAALIKAEFDFWASVEGDYPPVPPKPVESPIKPVRKVDMTGNNNWAFYAGEYTETAPFVKRNDNAVVQLKKIIEADVLEASGHGLTAKRDKRGAIRFLIEKGE